MGTRYNPPPNWPPAPKGWTPRPGWQPDPAWGPPPPGWQVWVEDDRPVEDKPIPDKPTGNLLTTGAAESALTWSRNHKTLTAVGGGVLAILLLASIGVSSGNPVEDIGGPEYPAEDLEADVARVYGDQGLSLTNVECEDTEDVKAGAITDCGADLRGKRIGVRVTWNDDEGHFKLQITGPIPGLE